MRAIEVGLREIVRCGVTHAFGIPAGSVNAIYDALLDIKEIKSVIVKHEASAGYMASAYSRITGRPSLAIGSSGPGATNLLTACANAFTEKSPVLFMTGSVPTHILGKGGAQELPASPLFKSITKLSMVIHNAAELPGALVHACETSISGIPGPVHVEIPINVQMAEIDLYSIVKDTSENIETQFSLSEIEEVAQILLQHGSCGAILLGYGAKSAKRHVLALAERLGFKVATTPRGKGAFPETHPLSLGVYGLAGHEQAIEYLHSKAWDVLLVIGSSLGESGTCNWDKQLVDGKLLIHMDYDVEVFDRVFTPFRTITGHIGPILAELMERLGEKPPIDIALQEIAVTVEEVSMSVQEVEFVPEVDTLRTRDILRHIGECSPEGTKFYVDIGELMTYAIQELTMKPGFDFDINIHFGGMGSGITSAIGAKLAEPERPVVCISGDGCFFMHGMEILTAKEAKIPVLFIVINNARLGMVYHGHMLQYQRCPSNFSQERINLTEVARSLGIEAYQVRCLADVTAERMLQWTQKGLPVFIEVVVAGNEIPPMGERVKFLQGATY